MKTIKHLSEIGAVEAVEKKKEYSRTFNSETETRLVLHKNVVHNQAIDLCDSREMDMTKVWDRGEGIDFLNNHQSDGTDNVQYCSSLTKQELANAIIASSNELVRDK